MNCATSRLSTWIGDSSPGVITRFDWMAPSSLYVPRGDPVYGTIGQGACRIGMVRVNYTFAPVQPFMRRAGFKNRFVTGHDFQSCRGRRPKITALAAANRG